MKGPKKIKIFHVRGTDADELDRMLRIHAARKRDEDKNLGNRHVIPPEIVKAIIGIATNTWKARRRIIDPVTGEAGEEMKRVYGDIERILRCLEDIGVVIEDHTNQPFDYGLPWKVVATKPTAGIEKERVTETLRPTIRWHDQIIQHAEVEIGTPVKSQGGT